ncbi:MAG: tRNA preQ1(34) S-adenosylmethionine ribosyltransferase-isomerase QueA [Pseudomonadota bacterium]
MRELSDYDYDLPPALIADRPAARRTASRLMVMGPGAVLHERFHDLPTFLDPGDLLVVNDTRVVKARLWGTKPTGGRVEILVERVIDSTHALVRARASRSVKVGQAITLGPNASVHCDAREGEFYRVTFSGIDPYAAMEQFGHVPLPPYIARDDDDTDAERYQTVYAKTPGAIAAPTAGLHFDDPLLAQLDTMGVRTATLTLHVGSGTFQPLRDENLANNRLHAEVLEVDSALCQAVAETKRAGRRVVAVGTTTVRALESASVSGTLEAQRAETELFIRPGYHFRTVDAMVTNFHLPKSSLLMLVSAFAGRERLLRAYREAVAKRYRFFSYGDAMFIPRIVESAV